MNRNIFMVNGIILILVGIVMGFAQTKAFGNHTIPQSTPEALCDIACLFIVITGYVLSTIGQAIPKSKE